MVVNKDEIFASESRTSKKRKDSLKVKFTDEETQKLIDSWSKGPVLLIFCAHISLLVLLASVLAKAKPAWLNFGQHRGPTYSYNNGSEKKRN